MLRRLIVPIFLILVVAGVGSMCSAVTGARAKRRLAERRELARTAVAKALPAPRDSARHTAGEAQIVACPEQLPDVATWRRMSAEGSSIEIPVPPDFNALPQSGTPDASAPFLVLRATNGDEYSLTRSTAAIRSRDFRDYESTSSCQITIGDVIADLETARDTWRGGEHRAVLASYRLGTMSFITIHGTTESAEHQRQLVAAIHGARFRAQ